ncbi:MULTISPECIES: DUF4229 domain-containing protein [unclassified Arthrobacter]|uniref:DUF4229 domain-containing protein n=1 Tax=unclassified Arthrobacter TaxID=235627 RepID=UPI001D1540C4|nr:MULTISPECIES: DUF4229 domain-containing protein [unclassified Arthrobacter]MCC9176508.1 DUF4229 domain-containing protein [Arthrobacter sp. zg-Y750]MCC3275905.1 DUF4229 domain-containing protein [Arthrobacter sp. zg-Y20]MDK1316062.1 DUF4229 domain-containing protein [Arthrobacter sp. zg.Y20]MDK1326788.1 DUF4229 domain-containing protein [Arthrobacter sp. zg-Y1143]WIB05647.1 DUF4229 domain-containing protein [Arthrobacter sp. zg-Y20]
MAFWKFTALRLGLVAVFFAISMWLGLGIVPSALAAAVIAWCVTYLFARNMRDEAARTVQRRFTQERAPKRNRGELDDAAAEDGMVADRPGVETDADRRRDA